MTQFRTIQFDPTNESAFGTLETGELEPLLQGDFVHGLNTQIWNTGVTSGTGATVDTNAGRLRIQCGTDAAGYAYITSRRIVKYRAGMGNTVRFTGFFSTGIADNIQLWGVGSVVSNNPYDGYFFGYNGTSFGIAHYIAGTPTWTAQSSWNGDKVDGSAGSSFTLNTTFGNPLMIKYPFLGFGNIEFFVLNPTTSQFVLVHTIRYANTSATIQLTNPNLQVVGFTKNSNNTTNKTMYMGSYGLFLSGKRSFIGNPKWAINNNKTAITTETNILTLRNATTYNGITNRSLILLNSVSFGANAGTAGAQVLFFKINATLGGSTAYTAINGTTADNGVTVTSGNSITSYNTAGTTVTGGTYIFNLGMNVGSNGANNQTFDLTPYDLFIAPTETLTISGSSTSSAGVSVAVNWTEDI